MKMIQLAMALMVVFALVLPVQVFGQCVDNNGDGEVNAEDYPVAVPISRDCGDYDDCNGNGAYDAGEPCHEGGDHPIGKGDHPTSKGDHPTSKGDHPTSKGDHPTSKGDHPTSKGDHPTSKGDHPTSKGDHPTSKGDHPTSKGDHPTSKGDHPTGGGESENEKGCPPRDDFHANCGAICTGMTEYWVDRDGDCKAEDGPFATWSEPTCPACPDDDDH